MHNAFRFRVCDNKIKFYILTNINLGNHSLKDFHTIMSIINDISVDLLESSLKEISITESNYSDNDLPDIYNRAVV